MKIIFFWNTHAHMNNKGSLKSMLRFDHCKQLFLNSKHAEQHFHLQKSEMQIHEVYL